MEVLASVDHDRLAGDEVRRRAGEVDDGADDVLGHLVALDRAGGDRHIPRQIEYIRKGARFLTTNSEIAFILAEGTRVTTELRRALAEK